MATPYMEKIINAFLTICSQKLHNKNMHVFRQEAELNRRFLQRCFKWSEFPPKQLYNYSQNLYLGILGMQPSDMAAMLVVNIIKNYCKEFT